MAWTNINKPIGPTWTNENPQGKEQYNESTIMYDDSSVFYDGVNPNQWSDVSKPVGPSWTSVSKPT